MSIAEEEIEKIPTEEQFMTERIKEAMWGSKMNDMMVELVQLGLTSSGLIPLYGVMLNRCIRKHVNVPACRIFDVRREAVDLRVDLDTENEGVHYGMRPFVLVQLAKKVAYFCVSTLLLDWQTELVEDQAQRIYTLMKIDAPIPPSLLVLRLPLWQDVPVRFFCAYLFYAHETISLIYLHRLPNFWSGEEFLEIVQDVVFDKWYLFWLSRQDWTSFTFTPGALPLAARLINSFNDKLGNYTTMNDHWQRLSYQNGILGGPFYGFATYLKIIKDPLIFPYFVGHYVLNSLRRPLARLTYRAAGLETESVLLVDHKKPSNFFVRSLLAAPLYVLGLFKALVITPSF